MKPSNFSESCRRLIMAPINLVLGFIGRSRHGPISKETIERLDRIRNPQKYLVKVNATDEP